MDWFLSITTVLTNCNLGWAKGVWWAWLLHIINAVIWIWFAVAIKQHGIILLSIITILIDAVSMWRSLRSMN